MCISRGTIADADASACFQWRFQGRPSSLPNEHICFSNEGLMRVHVTGSGITSHVPALETKSLKQQSNPWRRPRALSPWWQMRRSTSILRRLCLPGLSVEGLGSWGRQRALDLDSLKTLPAGLCMKQVHRFGKQRVGQTGEVLSDCAFASECFVSMSVVVFMLRL